MDLTIRTEDLITCEQAANLLGVSRPTVYNLIIRHNLHPVMIARNRYLLKTEVEALAVRLKADG